MFAACTRATRPLKMRLLRQRRGRVLESTVGRGALRLCSRLRAHHFSAAAGNESNKYILSMFPYPSGKLHMGHVRVYTISDCLARFWRLKGKTVLHPMGWDAFGLPAENAAFERGVEPSAWTYTNIDSMRQQMDAIGLQFDWADINEGRGLTTCSPDYYKWTQWLFLQLFESGLAYQKESEVNWDPVDRTVLANEQIDNDGKSWRSGAVAEKKRLVQWFFKTTEYQDELLDSLDGLGEWPEKVKQMQRSWIGKSAGSRVVFHAAPNMDGKTDIDFEPIQAFTTRVDTLYGVTFLAVSKYHPLVQMIVAGRTSNTAESHRREITSFVQEESANEDGASGIFLGVHALHPLTGEEIPVYLANYVIDDYGDGAVMGVPSHDDRDFRFAEEFGLPVKTVLRPNTGGDAADVKVETCARNQCELINSKDYSGIRADKAVKLIEEALTKKSCGGAANSYRLRDWLVSRQRFWGTPIPIIHCDSCGAVPVPIEDLPVMLPPSEAIHAGVSSAHDSEDAALTTPLSRSAGWNDVRCPQCGSSHCKRDPDTLDTFIDSSWYFLRHCDPENVDMPFSKDKIAKNMPVDTYIGGIEHAVMHLLYARFIQRFLWHKDLVSSPEPFKKLLTQGLVLGKTFKCPETGRYLLPNELSYASDSDLPFIRASGETPAVAWEKMSKSKHNGVDPEHVVAKYGSDVTRLASMFVAPPEQALEWDEAAVAGQARWVVRVRQLVEDSTVDFQGDSAQSTQSFETTRNNIRREIHSTIKSISKRFEDGVAFNVVIAELMKLSNYLSSDEVREHATSCKAVFDERKEGVKNMLLLMMPIAPVLSEELLLKCSVSPSQFEWPVFDPSALVKETSTVVIQLNGKKKAVLDVPVSICGSQDDLKAHVMASEEVSSLLGGKSPKRAIVVFQKTMNLVNFVM